MSLIKSVSGVRGIVRADPDGHPDAVTLNDEVVRRLGRAFATHLIGSEPGTVQPFIVGGRDGRPGGEGLLAAFAEGVVASGVDLIDIGIVTTPGLALMVKKTAAAGGVVITASHNPGQWNGVKFLTSQGRAPTKRVARSIFDIFDGGRFYDAGVTQNRAAALAATDDEGRREPFLRPNPPLGDPHEQHVDAVLGIVDVDRIRRRTFSVVLDSINGAGAAAGRLLLNKLGCRMVHLNAEPATAFAHTPEPIRDNLLDLCSRVRTEHADVGFAQDPDADRLAIVDQEGHYIGEEYSLAFAAKRVLQTCPGPVAVNLSTSRLIDDIVASQNRIATVRAGKAGAGRVRSTGGKCRVYRSAVGEANVVEEMIARGCVIGGEGNGGVIHPRVVHVRDSLVGMALVLDLLADQETSVSQLVASTQPYAMIKEKIAWRPECVEPALAAMRRSFDDEIVNDRDGVRVDWPDRREWIHLRASNTEPVMRIIVEATSEAAARKLMQRARAVIASTEAPS